jgi:hypothetical protein
MVSLLTAARGKKLTAPAPGFFWADTTSLAAAGGQCTQRNRQVPCEPCTWVQGRLLGMCCPMHVCRMRALGRWWHVCVLPQASRSSLRLRCTMPAQTGSGAWLLQAVRHDLRYVRACSDAMM